MGWKSTITITREEAIKAIQESFLDFNNLSNSELEQLMYKLSIGEEPGKPYFGHNFNIV